MQIIRKLLTTCITILLYTLVVPLIMLLRSTPTLAQTDTNLYYLYSIPLGRFLSGNVREIAWSPDGSKIALSGLGVNIYSLDEDTFIWLDESSNLGGPVSIAWSPDGSQLAGAGAQVVIWDTSSWEIIYEIGEEYRYRFYTDVAWHPTETKIAASSIGLEPVDWAVRIWNTTSAELLLQIEDNVPPPDHSGSAGFTSVEFVPSAQLILAASGTDRLVRGWDIISGKLISTIEMNYIVADISASKNSQQVAISSFEDNTVSVWDMSNEKLVDTIQTEDTVQGIVWNPLGDTLVILDNTHIYIWSTADGLRQISEISGPKDVDWSSDGDFVAVLVADRILVFEFK